MTRKLPDAGHLIDEQITRQIIGAFFECYNLLGHGQFESVYRKALLHEMHLRGLTASEETAFEVRYKEVLVGLFRLDLLVENRIVVEVKSTPSLSPADRRQLKNYLRVTGLEVGLLLHFGHEPRFERCINAELFMPRKRRTRDTDPASSGESG
jgi:GxxExxY protein